MLKALEVDYYPQEIDNDCGVAVVQMIRNQQQSKAASIRQEVLTRHRRTSEEFPDGCALEMNTISWLLYPLRCHWHKHPDVPVRFSYLQEQIDAGRPVILFLLSADKDVGHYVLMTGYDSKASDQRLLLLDPRPGIRWQSAQRPRPEARGRAGHHAIRYSAIAEGLDVVPEREDVVPEREDVSSANGLRSSELSAGLRYCWTATGILDGYQEV